MKGLEAKGPFSCLGPPDQKGISDTNKVLIPLACEILFKYSSFNIFKSYFDLKTELSAKKL